jgi:antitoxin CptB
MSEDPDYKRLRWRSRRGMLELDLLLIPFFDDMYADLPKEQQDTFVVLLEQDDPDLLLWFSKKGRPEDAKLAAMVEMIIDRVQPD